MIIGMAVHPVLVLALGALTMGAVTATVAVQNGPPGAAAARNSPPPAAAASPAPATHGFRLPLHPPAAVLRRFVLGPYRWSPGHRGVDLAAATGQPVLAAGPGTITVAGPLAGRGVVVVLHPNGIRTTYEPVRPAVTRGEAVSAGAVIGVIDSAVRHCAQQACLHWGALRGDQYLDPLLLLQRRGPPVLLPLGRAERSAHLGQLGPQLQDGLGVHLADP